MRMDRVAGHVIELFAVSHGRQCASENIMRVGSVRLAILHRPVRVVPVIDSLLSTPLVPLVFFAGRCAARDRLLVVRGCAGILPATLLSSCPIVGVVVVRIVVGVVVAGESPTNLPARKLAIVAVVDAGLGKKPRLIRRGTALGCFQSRRFRRFRGIRGSLPFRIARRLPSEETFKCLCTRRFKTIGRSCCGPPWAGRRGRLGWSGSGLALRSRRGCRSRWLTSSGLRIVLLWLIVRPPSQRELQVGSPWIVSIERRVSAVVLQVEGLNALLRAEVVA